MRSILKRCEVPFVILINLLILLFIIYTYTKGCINYAVYGILIMSMGTSLGIIRNDFFKLHSIKLKMIQIVILLCGLTISTIGFLNNLPK